jgi:hypothetical protein
LTTDPGGRNVRDLETHRALGCAVVPTK